MAPASAGGHILASRSVDSALQEIFCSFSGDRNPSHADPLLARRTAVGEITVHGAHTLLWALETLAQQGLLTRIPSRLRVKYLRLLLLDQSADVCVATDAGANPTRVWVAEHGSTICSVDLEYAAVPSNPFDVPDGHLTPRAQPAEHAFADLEGTTGEAFVNTNAAARELFPALAALAGARLGAELAACSYLVGMEAPGRHSMSSGMDLKIREAAVLRAGLGFSVIYTDERFRKLRLALDGATFAGTLEAFVAPPPVQQPSMEAALARITPGEFAGMHALVVGGSRGLGELTAKLIAAGGGSPTITYARGDAEATALLAEIHAHHAPAEMVYLDVLQPPSPQLLAVAPTFTHLFYFATNAIFRPSGELLSSRFLDEFLAFYVHGFHRLCVAFAGARGTGTPLIAFYPSTTALDDRPAGMTEYAMAKAAGEQLCRDMNQIMPNMRIQISRLPRLATDQTAAVLPGKHLDAIEVLLPILRQMMQG